MDYFDHLERQGLRIARQFYERPAGDGSQGDVSAGLEREIMLVLGHLDRLRLAHEKSRRDLLEMEVQARNQLHRIHPSGDLFAPSGHPMQARMEDRLHRLDLERMRLESVAVEKTRPMHDRLHQLLVRHAVLSM